MNSLESVWSGGELTRPEQPSLNVCTRLVLYDFQSRLYLRLAGYTGDWSIIHVTLLVT
jgi:hypothetical protein